MIKNSQSSFSQPFLNQLRDLQIPKLFDSLPEVQFWIKNHLGQYIKVNTAFLKKHSLSQETHIIGRSDFDIAPAYIAEQWIKDDKSVLKGQTIKDRVELVGGFNQKVSWHVTNKIPLYSKRGTIIGTSGTTRLLNASHHVDEVYMELSLVVEYINSNFSSAISNEELANLVHLSKSAFERKFKKFFKLSPQQYLKKFRINVACKKLLESDISIVQIALECGFCDHSYMSKEFRMLLGKTPNDIRKNKS